MVEQHDSSSSVERFKQCPRNLHQPHTGWRDFLDLGGAVVTKCIVCGITLGVDERYPSRSTAALRRTVSRQKRAA